MTYRRKKVKVKVPKHSNTMELLNAIETALEALLIIQKKLDEKYNKRVKFNLELIGERAVDIFYESYSPNMYSRQEGLYSAVKVTVNNEEDWSIETDAKYMTGGYDAGAPYVFWNSFQNGFHGGAVDGPGHPNPGEPWWKAYGEWYKPAVPGPSIEDAIVEQNPSDYINEQEREYDEESVKLFMPYYEKCVNLYKIWKWGVM